MGRVAPSTSPGSPAPPWWSVLRVAGIRTKTRAARPALPPRRALPPRQAHPRRDSVKRWPLRAQTRYWRSLVLDAWYGSCPYRGTFALRLSLESATATDDLSYRVGSGRLRRLQVDPGETARIALPAGGLKLRTGEQIRATPTVSLRVEQPTQPHTIIMRARLRLAESRDGTQRCLLIGTSLRSRVYFSDGGPPR